MTVPFSYYVDVNGMEILKERMTSCEQEISVSCTDTNLYNDQNDAFTWWEGPDGHPLYFWGGAAPSNCPCGDTGTCNIGIIKVFFSYYDRNKNK